MSLDSSEEKCVSRAGIEIVCGSEVEQRANYASSFAWSAAACWLAVVRDDTDEVGLHSTQREMAGLDLLLESDVL